MENLEICARCGGKCCKNYPGIFKPEELGDNFLDRIGKDLVLVLDINVDPVMAKEIGIPDEALNLLVPYWEELKKEGLVGTNGAFSSECFILAVRPKAKSDVAVINSTSSYKGVGNCVCSFWRRKSGCKLSHEERPWVCKELVPRDNFICGNGDSVFSSKFLDMELVRAWKPYQGMLWEWVDAYVLDTLTNVDYKTVESMVLDEDSVLGHVMDVVMEKRKKK